VTFVDEVAHGLADEVGRDGVAAQGVVGQQRPFLLAVFRGRSRGIDVEVVAPAGEFEAVVAHFLRKRRKFLQGQVGPLAGK